MGDSQPTEKRPEQDHPTWHGKPAVYSHVTHSRNGDMVEEGDELVVMFHDRAVVTEVTKVVTELGEE